MIALTDEQLMDQLKSGDTASIDELYRRYAKKLYAFCSSLMAARNPEDLVHDVFMRVIERAQRYNQKKASFRTWLFRIARNRCIDLLRHEKKIKILSLEQQSAHSSGEKALSLGDTLASDGQHTEKSFEDKAAFQAVHDCIKGLRNEEEKQAIVLYYILDKVYREIGEIFSKSITIVKRRIAAAEEKVKRCLERKGIVSFP
jgi:RNA polymerase sigma-70 factor (ECF subfamily)